MDGNLLSQFQHLFQQLLLEEDYQEGEVSSLFTGNGLGDEFDRASQNSNEQIILKMNGRKRLFRKKIIHALQKIQHGDFGHCEECDGDISIKRLMARPTAELCIQCKEEQEGHEHHMTYEKKSHTNGKIIQGELIPFKQKQTEYLKDSFKNPLSLVF